MAVIGDATIEVHADTDKFTKGVGSKFGAAAKAAAAAFATAFAASKAFDFVGDALAEAREAAQVQRLTDAVVKSTGGAANVTAGHLSDLAERLSNIAAVDDEVIQSAGNVLLTFTKVRNEVGAGNDVFDRASEAALNMSAALKTDLQGATLQLGKALNDPIKGITALSRAGVSFTQQQKDQIKTLVESGKTLEAQKIILGELEGEFGGAAAAAADPTARLGVVIGNLKERIGTALLPVVEKVAVWLSNNLPAALDVAARFFHKARDAIAPAIEQVQAFINTLRTGFTEDEGTPIERLALSFRESLLPVIATVVGFVRDSLLPALADLGRWLADNKPVVIGLGVALGLLVAPFTTVAAAAVLAYTRFEGFRDVVDGVVRQVRGFVADLVAGVRSRLGEMSEAFEHIGNFIRGLWQAVGDDVLALVRSTWTAVRDVISNALRAVRDVIDLVLSLINGDWGKAWRALKDLADAVWDGIWAAVKFQVERVRFVIEAALSVLRVIWDKGWEEIAGVLGGAWNSIVSAVVKGKDRVLESIRGLLGAITDAFGGAATWLYDIGKDIIGGLWDGIYDATIGTLKDGLSWVGDRIPDWKGPISKDRKLLVPTGKAIIQGLLDGIKASTGDVRSYLQAFTANIVTEAQSAIAAIRVGLSVERAQRNLDRAERERADVQRRAAQLPGLLADATRDVERARADAAKVTPEEQLRIDRAMAEVQARYEAWQAALGDQDVSPLERRVAEGEYLAAQRELNDALKDSTGITDDVTAAIDRLNTLRDEQRQIADRLADAEEAVTDAQLSVVDAQAALTQSSANLAGNTALAGWFTQVAEAAGFTRAQIQGLLADLGLLTGATPAVAAASAAVGANRSGSVQVPGGGSVGADFASWFAQQPKSVQDALVALGPGFNQALTGGVVYAPVSYHSIDTKGLLERMDIKAAVGEAVSSSTRLRPVH